MSDYPGLGRSQRTAATFTREAADRTYAAGQLIRPNAANGGLPYLTFKAGLMFGETGQLVGGRLRKSGAGQGNFRFYLLRDIPQIALADGAALVLPKALDVICWLDFVTDIICADGSLGLAAAGPGPVRVYECLSDRLELYGLLVATGAYTSPSGENFGLTIEHIRG